MTTPIPPDLTDLSVQWLSALLDSASVDQIGVSNWWTRATSALEAAAAGADSGAQAVSIACRKLQIDCLSKQSAATLAQLTPLIDAHFGQWVSAVAKESPYIVALTRVAREERRTARKATPA